MIGRYRRYHHAIQHLCTATEDQLAEVVLPPPQHGANATSIDRGEEVQSAVARKAALAEPAASQLWEQ